MERHFQTFLLSILTTALLALVAFIWNAQTALTTLSVRLTQVSDDLSRASDSIGTLAASAETKTEHLTDVLAVRAELQDHEARIRQAERAHK